MHSMNHPELRSFLAALGLNIQQFETVSKPQPKQAEQPKQSGYEDMQELIERVTKQKYARPLPQGTSQTKEQADFQHILNRLERLEQNERKQSSSTFQSSEDYVNALEDENEKLEDELHRISKQYEITARKLAVQEEKNIKLFKTSQDSLHQLKEEKSDILKRYGMIYKNNIELTELNKSITDALERAINSKSNPNQSGIAMAKTSSELSRLVEENNELKQKLDHRTRLSIENSDRMAEEFKRQLEEINTLRMEVDILREENFHLGEKIEDLTTKEENI